MSTTAIIEAFLEKLPWTRSGFSAVACLDEGFAEAFKWNWSNDMSSSQTAVLPLNAIQFLKMKPDHIAMFISGPLKDHIDIIRRTLENFDNAELIILTTSSPDAPSHDESDGPMLQQEYSTVLSQIQPFRCKIMHLPLHTINVLVPTDSNGYELFALSSTLSKSVHPLTLHKMGWWNIKDTINSVADVAATDVPPDVAKQLKFLSHELAAALVFNLGLDPTGSIFVLGKTSAMVGHDVQDSLPRLIDDQKNPKYSGNLILQSLLAIQNQQQQQQQQQQLGGPTSGSLPSASSPNRPRALAKASLLLIDRTQDLVSPCSYGGATGAGCPLAQRIMGTIPRVKRPLDESHHQSHQGHQGQQQGPQQAHGAPAPTCDITLMAEPLSALCGSIGSITSLAVPSPLAIPAAKSQLHLNVSSSPAGGGEGRVGGEGGGGGGGGGVATEAAAASPSSVAHSLQALSRLDFPFSALAGLPVKIPPSLCLRSAAASAVNLSGAARVEAAEGVEQTTSQQLQLLQEAIMCGGEEEGKAALCSQLSAAIHAHGGTPPPAKKRGLGAEVLALVQALTNAPGGSIASSTATGLDPSLSAPGPVATAAAGVGNGGGGNGGGGVGGGGGGGGGASIERANRYSNRRVNSQLLKKSLGYNPQVCSQSQALLGVAFAVIEAMQRSSAKQFAQVCSWQCSYDVRAAREAHLDSLLAKGRIAIASGSIGTGTGGGTGGGTSSGAAAGARQMHMRAYVSACISQVLSYLQPPAAGTASAAAAVVVGGAPTSSSATPTAPAAAGSASGAKAKAKAPPGAKTEEDPKAGPADLVHVMLLLTRLLSLVGKDMCDRKDFQLLVHGIGGYLKHHSPVEELLHLVQMGLLRFDLVRDVLQCREFSEDSSSSNSAASSSFSSPEAAANSAGESAGAQDEEYSFRCSEQLRVKLEMEDISSGLVDRLQEVAGFRKVVFRDPIVDLLSDAEATKSKRGPDDTVQSFEPLGVVARTILAFLTHKSALSGSGPKSLFPRPPGAVSVSAEAAPPSLFPRPAAGSGNPPAESVPSSSSMASFKHVQTALQQLKQAGLGLLTSGLGRLGIGAPSTTLAPQAHPGDSAVVVVFVIGGISFNELAQIRRVVAEFHLSHGASSKTATEFRNAINYKIVIGSTSIVSPVELFCRTFVD